MKAAFLIGMVLMGASVVSFPGDPLKESIERGRELYGQYCIACHLGAGQGVPGAIPPLAGSDALAKDPNRAIRALKYGQSGPIVVNGVKYSGYMPDPGLDDDEVADVLNFIRNSWGNRNETLVTEAAVAQVKKK